MLEQYKKIFKALIQSNSRLLIFATLARRSDLLGYLCPCKETCAEKHPQLTTNYSIIQLAITSSCIKQPDLYPTKEQLSSVRERLSQRPYNKLYAYLKKKG